MDGRQRGDFASWMPECAGSVVPMVTIALSTMPLAQQCTQLGRTFWVVHISAARWNSYALEWRWIRLNGCAWHFSTAFILFPWACSLSQVLLIQADSYCGSASEGGMSQGAQSRFVEISRRPVGRAAAEDAGA